MLINELPIIMIRCLIITVVIETIIAVVIGLRNKDILNVVLVNIITNPLAVSISTYIGYRFGKIPRSITVAILELLVLIFEGLLYCKFIKHKKINGFVISAILNCSSYFIGKIINLFLI